MLLLICHRWISSSTVKVLFILRWTVPLRKVSRTLDLTFIASFCSLCFASYSYIITYYNNMKLVYISESLSLICAWTKCVFFMASVLRLTVVLCKEISLLSKKFTSCLTAAGVRVMTPTVAHFVHWCQVHTELVFLSHNLTLLVDLFALLFDMSRDRKALSSPFTQHH